MSVADRVFIIGIGRRSVSGPLLGNSQSQNILIQTKKNLWNIKFNAQRSCSKLSQWLLCQFPIGFKSSSSMLLVRKLSRRPPWPPWEGWKTSQCELIFIVTSTQMAMIICGVVSARTAGSSTLSSSWLAVPDCTVVRRSTLVESDGGRRPD